MTTNSFFVLRERLAGAFGAIGILDPEIIIELPSYTEEQYLISITVKIYSRLGVEELFAVEGRVNKSDLSDNAKMFNAARVIASKVRDRLELAVMTPIKRYVSPIKGELALKHQHSSAAVLAKAYADKFHSRPADPPEQNQLELDFLET